MRILVVDDNDQMRDTFRIIFEAAGHEVLDTASGKIALHLQEALPADLVITDILMPEMDGIDFIKGLRKMAPSIKIIAVSGGGKIDAHLCLNIAGKLGADRVLLKPFSKSALMSMVGELFSDSNSKCINA